MSVSKKPVVIALVGPTASGKTALSLELAHLLNAEIIACDSRTIYKGMDIGTAKPSPQERSKVRHYLLDVANPDEIFTVAQFTELAKQAIDNIFSRGKTPIICGGTGFYAKALLGGLDIPKVTPQQELRRCLNLLADTDGNEGLYRRLQQLDPVRARQLNPNDRFRIVRSLEVSMATGQPFSQLVKKIDLPFHTVWIGLNVRDRNFLKELIKKRFYNQIEQGLIEEVERLLKLYGPSHTLVNTVNYKEVIEYLYGRQDLGETKEQCLLRNYQLARKQLIWFRANPEINWFHVDELETNELIELVHKRITCCQ